MGITKIEWTATYNDDGTVTPGYTFNPWQGCIKVSPGCQNCYALTLSNRWGKDIWGPGPKRERTSRDYWDKPFAWNKKAEKEGKRYKVFCASMADVFEDNPQLLDWRSDLWDLIELTPNLDWLLLTKRPENIKKFTRRWETWEQLPDNIWLGTSVEGQEYADKRIPELLKIPAKVRFLSCEPLLGPIDLSRWLWEGDALFRVYPDMGLRLLDKIHWVITGGESGKGARPCHPDWIRSLSDQCQAAGVAFFHKQWGEWLPVDEPNGRQVCRVDPEGKFYTVDHGMVHNTILRDKDWQLMARVGKKLAGRLLDGREHNEFPK